MLGITRIFRLGIRFATWATPHVKEWHRQRHFNRSEGQRHLGSRNWVEAEKHLALALSERKHPTKPRIDLLLNLATAQRHQRKFVDAEQTALTAIGLAAQSSDHGRRMQAMDGLVDVQLDQGKYAEAEETVVEMERLEGTQPNPDNGRLARCSRKLGTALLKSERNDEALAAFERAARLSEQAFGDSHLETANNFAELGMLYRKNGDHPSAQRCLRRALQIHRTAAGPDSHEATQDLFHLAASLEESGDLDGAAAEYERVLALSERQVGGNRENKVEAQVRLAALYVNAGRTSAARELLTQAIDTLERVGGPRLRLALVTMACAEERAGRVDDAKLWNERALSVALDQAS